MASPCTPTATGPARSRRRRTNPSTCSRSSESSPGGRGSAWSFQSGKVTSQECPASSVTPGIGGCAGRGVTVTQDRWWQFLGCVCCGEASSQLSLPHPHFASLIPSFPCPISPSPFCIPVFTLSCLLSLPHSPFPHPSFLSLFSLLHPHSLLHIFPSALSSAGRICIYCK